VWAVGLGKGCGAQRVHCKSQQQQPDAHRGKELCNIGQGLNRLCSPFRPMYSYLAAFTPLLLLLATPHSYSFSLMSGPAVSGTSSGSASVSGSGAASGVSSALSVSTSLSASVSVSGAGAVAISGVGRAILWDVDGTLSDSYMLGFSSTQKVLSNNGKAAITEDEYHLGTKYTTPRRLSWHVTGMC
jgi:hypothetical protein